ncbi:hypothetical protein A2V71_00845 [Candidatus Berkelbacteria bacterium RBG_13_40_8]|uniref:Uncharacterized protein n=1 Tax=Candidatus Berkelbacteria bacterium RBG_13_40_8 TaxID=1797467 RepID=A0A1F5DQL5_9BACT|nr:MAG: hypothetical protein A2V71_00845 [Candidatus Berkelbacteria bacterium RBG_13_40_8]
MANKKVLWIIGGVAVLLIALGTTGYFVYKNYSQNQPSKKNATKSNQDKDNKTTETPAYTLVGYTGEVFGAKVPKGWEVTDNESGIDIMDNTDSNTGAAGAVAVGWFGSETPDGFIDFLLNAIGAQNVAYENESAQEEITDPTTDLKWQMKTKTFTFDNKDGKEIKAKASAGVLNGYGQFMGMITAFQTTPEKWDKWAPTLERIAQSITIINPSKAGGIDKVRLPTAADLANDSSPIMDSWEYRNKSTERTSHNFSDAIMGQESDLYSPSTGQDYTLPLSAYDPTIGGYRNPDNSSEILIDPYER